MELKIYNNGAWEVFKCEDIKYGIGVVEKGKKSGFRINHGTNEKKILLPDRFFFDEPFESICKRAEKEKDVPCRWVIIFCKERTEVLVFNEPSDSVAYKDVKDKSKGFIMENGKTIDHIF